MSQIKVTMFGIASMFSTVVGIPGNLVAFIHFVKEKEKISSFLYRCISASDLVICLLMIPKIATSFNPSNSWVFENHYFCEAWNILWKTSYKFSLFAVMMLSAVRSYCLIFPFNPVRSSLIKILTVSYLLILILEEILLKVFLKFVSHYDVKHGHCLWLLQLPDRADMTSLIDPYSDQFKVLVSLYWDVQVTVPMLLVIITCLVTLIHMVVTTRSQETSHIRNGATGTVLIITASWILFNLPHCLVRGLDTISILTEYHFKWHTHLSPATIGFLYTFLDAPVFALNAAGNPLIYIWRMKELRIWLGGAPRSFTKPKHPGSANDKQYWKMGQRKRGTSAKTKSSKV